MLSLVRATATDNPSPTIPLFIQKPKRVEPKGTDLSDLVVDFSAANSLTERIFLVCEAAAMNGRLVSTAKVGEYLLDHDQTTATLRNITGSVSHCIGDHEKHFTKLRPGLYRYLSDVEPESLTFGDSDQGDRVVK